jgi:hypothetical protein
MARSYNTFFSLRDEVLHQRHFVCGGQATKIWVRKIGVRSSTIAFTTSETPTNPNHEISPSLALVLGLRIIFPSGARQLGRA